MAINNNTVPPTCQAANLIGLYLATQNIMLDVTQISHIEDLISKLDFSPKAEWSEQDNLMLRDNSEI